MNQHVCAFRAETEWAVEEDVDGFLVKREVKVYRCPECGAVNSSRPGDRRHRWRAASLQVARIPADLLHALPGRTWRSHEALLGRLITDSARLDVIIKEWLAEGWAEVEEQRKPWGDRWEWKRARLSSAAHDLLVVQPAAQRSSDDAARRAEVLQKLDGWRSDLLAAREMWVGDEAISALLARLGLSLEGQERALRTGSWATLPDTSQRAGGPLHERWLVILRGIIAHLATGDWQYERTFSALWLGGSKELARDRRDIVNYLGIDTLTDIGLFTHTPVVYCWGDFSAAFGSLVIDGRAGVPFVALSAETVSKLQSVRVRAKMILVIENQTVFEAALRSPLVDERILYRDC